MYTYGIFYVVFIENLQYKENDTKTVELNPRSHRAADPPICSEVYFFELQ